MTATPVGNGETAMDAGPTLRLNVLDALLQHAGFKSQAAVARALGLNRSHWFGIRAGTHEPKISTALRIARLAGTSVEALWSEHGE